MDDTEGMTIDLTATEADIVVTPEALQAAVPQAPVHVMWDIETWGTGNDALPVSIGACKFNENNIVECFHVGIDPVSAQAYGLKIDAQTILWWMGPDRREALDEWLKLERIDLPSALLGLDLWIKNGPGVLSVWGNGSTFDNVILRSAFKAVGHEYPVGFWQDACYRTVKNRAAAKIDRTGTHHNALDDAVSQAKHLQAIWREQDQTELRDMLRVAQSQFNFYAELHSAKGTPEGDEKAKTNSEFAAKIGRVLDGGPNAA